jgi:hypothetical protein
LETRTKERLHCITGMLTALLPLYYTLIDVLVLRNGIIDYGPSYQDLWSRLGRLVGQIRTSEGSPLISVLLEGPAGTGKTALAAKLCTDSDFPYVRMISPDSMMGIGEHEKCSRLVKAFTDSYRSVQPRINVNIYFT